MSEPHALLVDDDKSIRFLLSTALTDSGFRVSEAENGQQALSIYRNEFPDVIITDILMPDRDGLELMMAIQGLNPDAKIIAITGGGNLNQSLLLKMSETLGATRVLQKPFNPEELVDAARELLSSR